MSEAQKHTRALGGRWYGDYGQAACPVCQSERRPDQGALVLRDGDKGLLLRCHKSNCGFRKILASGGIAARAPSGDRLVTSGKPAHRQRGSEYFARSLWNEARPIRGSIAETYLRVRMVGPPQTDTLRFHPRTWHGPTRQSLPAMIARIDGIDGVAVSRTYLAPDGSGKAKLPKSEQKMLLGTSAGGHVTLKTGPGPLCIAEGIETTLALPHLFSGEPMTLWAALSAVNMRTLRLPGTPGHLVIAADGDTAGRDAADTLASRARDFGWTVEIQTAPDGLDWNDVWRMRSGRSAASRDR